jgi:hypothetical protein
LTQVLALLADNTAGDISPQDIRDAIVSLAPAYGALYFSASATSAISVAGTFVKAAGTTASVDATTDVTVATSNRITYTGPATMAFRVHASASVLCSPASEKIGIAIAKNGTVVAATAMAGQTGTAGDLINIATFATVDLATDGYVELWVANYTTGSGTVTVEYGRVGIMSMLGV